MPAVKRLSSRKLAWLFVIGLVPSLVGAHPVASSSLAAGGFNLAAIHPEAAAYPTLGNSLVGLTPWQGRLYTGYGHWLEYTGIFDFPIRAYDPTTDRLLSTWVTEAEAVWNYRPIGTKLYVPVTDPTGEVDYAVGEPWHDRDAIAGTKRVFDMATLTGSDLFMVGSTGADAVAWRSTNGGQTWQESLRVPRQNPLDSETHFRFAMVAGGKLYVQAVGIGPGGAHPTSKVFNGTTWSNGPDLLPDSSYKGWKPTPFAGRMVFLSGDPKNASAALLTFDGVQVTKVPTLYRVWDFFVSGSYIYALALDPGSPLWAPVVRRTTDLITWSDVAIPPTYSRSIAVLNGYLYVGATEGRLYEYSEPVRRCRQPSRPMSICRRFEGI